MMVSRPRLNGKQLVRNYNPKLRLRCQHCTKIVRTKKLEFDVVCPNCGNYAKRAEQEVKPIIEFEKSSNCNVTTFIIRYPENPIEAVLP